MIPCRDLCRSTVPAFASRRVSTTRRDPISCRQPNSSPPSSLRRPCNRHVGLVTLGETNTSTIPAVETARTRRRALTTVTEPNGPRKLPGQKRASATVRGLRVDASAIRNENRLRSHAFHAASFPLYRFCRFRSLGTRGVRKKKKRKKN